MWIPETLPKQYDKEIAKIAIVIPCYRVRQQIQTVIERIGAECQRIYVVDDACPEETGSFVQTQIQDNRVCVLFHQHNQGVGGAVMTGMRQAIADGATIVVKIDGDGQMDPSLLYRFVQPILLGEADYTKGNRFYDLDLLRGMPLIRLLGNAGLSFISKLSSGYWNIFDPTNGYVAIHSRVLSALPLHKINRRYFFESDLLFQLYLIRAVVVDIPMKATYGNERSNLKIERIIFSFCLNHLRNLLKRIGYVYFLRDFSIASIYLMIGCILTLFGTIFGAIKWYSLAIQGIEASAGTVMLAALPVILGFQLILAFLAFDTGNIPRRVIHKTLFDDLKQNY
jgi:dolichol-phosphate mannosyltransferase